MEDNEYYTESESSYLTLCAEPTIIEGLRFAKDLIIVNVFLRFLIQFISMPNFVKHILALLLGSFLLYNTVGFAFMWTAGLTVGSYFLLMILTLVIKKHRGIITSALVMCFLLESEFLVVDSKMWHQIRGIQMIAAMKVISVAIDLDKGFTLEAPSPAAYAGYIMSPASCVLGPWVSFHKYNESLERKYLNRQWLNSVFVNTLLSVFALFLSNCFTHWYISDDSLKWLVAYRDAQSFRMSHYFVSTLSSATMVAGGSGEKEGGSWGYPVTRPLHIEAPRSLVQVVIYWNMPMHQWLKTYVFKVCQPYGKFVAIFATYTVSSLLHGLNFQLSAALLSIGMFSYVEYKMRAKISSILSACCLVNPCNRSCAHVHKSGRLFVMCINCAFSLLAMVHLAYLGVMFEASLATQETGYSYVHTMNKWAELGFASHLVAALTYIICIVM